MICPHFREWDEAGCEAGERLIVINAFTVNRFCASGSYRSCPNFEDALSTPEEGFSVLG